MAPTFSIVVPAYRATSTIPTTIESVLNQTIEDFELLVVDDGSGDSTADVIAAYAERDERIRLIRQENAGTAAARNTGVAHSSGRFVSLLDNDDAWLPGYLSAVEAELERHPWAGLAYADAWTFDEHTKRVHRLTTLQDLPPLERTLGAEDLLEALLRVNFITASSATLTREALGEVGAFATEISGSDDWDMWLRVAGAGYGAIRAGSEPLVLLRESETSQSKDLRMMIRAGVSTVERAVERAEPGSKAAADALEARNRLGSYLQRLEDTSSRRARIDRLRGAASKAKRRATRRWTWKRPPPQVRAVLSASEEL